MSDFITVLLQWINTHPQLAGLLTFIISAAESVAIIGTIVPGSVLMTALGTLAGAGVMPLGSTICWAILGAVVGDGVSYWIGYYFKDRLYDVWPFRSYPNVLAKGEKFFRKHGGKSVFIGRFVGPVRALVPLVAGMLKMKPLRFTIANITSAIGWAPAYMLPGIALGAASLELPPDIAVHAILIILLITFFIILCLWILKEFLSLIGKQINQALTLFWSYLQGSRYFSLLASAIKDYDPQKPYGQFTLAFYFIMTTSAFLYLAYYIGQQGAQDLIINKFFFHFFRSLRSDSTDSLMICLTFLGESKVILPVIIILSAWLAWTKRLRTAAHVLLLGILVTVNVELFKHFTHSPRPWGIMTPPQSNSFPSGHTTCATAFYLGLALLLVKVLRERYRYTIYFLAGMTVLAVATSRLYLDAHWFTDIAGGILLGASILMFTVLSYNRQIERKVRPTGIIMITLLALAICYHHFCNHSFQQYKTNYQQLSWPTYTASTNAWWKQEGEHLPHYRLNRFGFETQLLNVQWIGNIEKIKAILLQNGWQIPTETNWIDVLHRLSDVQSAEHLPLVSPVYLDKEPVLVFTKQANGSNRKLIVLRLWEANIKFNDSNQSLWVGAAEVVPRTYSWLFKRTRASDINLSAQLLFTKKPAQYVIKEISVKNQHKRRSDEELMLLIKPA